MAVDREKTLHAAQSFLNEQKLERALQEYQKLIEQDPNDTRTLLRIGDIQARTGDFVGAIATYDRVGHFYTTQGFALKAIAVFKQIRQLVHSHVTDQADDYLHVVDKLLSLYGDLGLINDALMTLDEEANRLRAQNREDDAVTMYRRMTEIASTIPLPHLRLAEGLCRVGNVEEAMESFWSAAELLFQAGRPDDALRVAERMLHFKPDPKTAKAAARIYLSKGTQAEGMQALSRLQICFQADPKDLETLELLAEAFEVIGQSSKAFEVRKEIVRQAHEQGRSDLFHATLRQLQDQAPEDEQVRALTQLPPPGSSIPADRPSQRHDVHIPPAPGRPHIDSEPVRPPQPSAELETIEEMEFLDDSGIEPNLDRDSTLDRDSMLDRDSTLDRDSVLDRDSMLDRDSNLAEDLVPGSEELEVPSSAAVAVDVDSFEAPLSVPPRVARPSAAPDEDSPVVSLRPPEHEEPPPESTSAEIQIHVRRALADALSFRGLRLFDKAIETLQVALEFAPQSIELREALRDLYLEKGDQVAAVEEMLTMSVIYVEYGRPDHAETVLRDVLEAFPNHPAALASLQRLRQTSAPSHPAPSTAATSEPETRRAESRPSSPGSSVEETLEEAEFFISRGLYDDALLVLQDQLEATPGHPLLLEALAELDELRASEDSEVVSLGAPLTSQSPPAAPSGSRPPTPAPPSRPPSAPPTSRRPSSRPVVAAHPPGTQSVVPQTARSPGTAAASRPVPSSLPPALDRSAKVAPAPTSAPGVSAKHNDHPTPSTPSSTASHPTASRPDSAVPTSAPRSSSNPAKAVPSSSKAAPSPASSSPLNGAKEASPPNDTEEDDADFDLRASLVELERAVRESQNPPPPGQTSTKGTVDVDQVFAKFKARVRTEVSDQDSGTHYDLGVAYKEMRLFDDAIGELKLAARDPARECNCYSMIGLIHAEQGRWDEAAKSYTRALSSVKKTVAQEASLYYDLGHVHQQKGQHDQAAYYFQQVLRRDSDYRDAKERLQQVRAKSNPPRGQSSGDDELDRAFEELLGD